MATVYKVTSADALDAGGRLSMSTFARVFTVEATNDATGLRVALSVSGFEALQVAGVVPKIGDPVAATWSVGSVFGTLRYRRFQVTEQAGVLTINAQASTKYVWDHQYPYGAGFGRAWLPIVGAFVARPVNVRAFRTWNNVTYPADPFALGTSDIGGTKIDSATQPRETIIDGGELVLATFLDTLATKKGDAWTDALNNFVGRSNSATFLGFPKGSLIMVDYPTPHEEDEYHAINIRFLYSPVLHLEQIAATDADFRVIADANGQATTVRWIRPVTYAAVDFNLIFGAAGADADFRKWRAEHGLFLKP
jgi:hypothetical protein